MIVIIIIIITDPLHTIEGTANYIFALEIIIIIVEITTCAPGCCRRRRR